MRLYIIRHGQTEWNALRKLQGGQDIELSPEGLRQVEERRGYYDQINPDIIYSSPLVRARRTAEMLFADRGIPIVVDNRLREISFGINEGRLKEERTPGCDLFFTDPAAYVPAEGGESFETLLARTKDFIESVLVPLSIEHPDYKVLISGHGALDKALMINLLGQSKADFWSGASLHNLYCAEFEIKGHEYTMIHDFQ